MTTTIAVLTPTLNSATFVGEAVASVSPQRNLRMYVQDGGSSDATLAILDAAAQSGTDIALDSRHDSGLSEAMNRAVARVSEEALGWLNSDEFYLPWTGDVVGQAFDQGADIVIGDRIWVSAEGLMLRYQAVYPNLRFPLRTFGCVVPTASFFARSDIVREFPFGQDYKRAMDWDFFLRVLDDRSLRIVHLPVALAAFRVHASQITATGVARDSRELLDIRARNGIAVGWVSRPVMHVVGRVVHNISRLRSGALLREIRARPLVGEDMKWFNGADVSALAPDGYVTTRHA